MSTADYIAKYTRRKTQRETVERYWTEDARRPAGALDSSLKKHTNLLNKLKTNLFASPPDALLKDIDGLTLTKYLEEIVAAVVEGASKGKGDIDSAVEVIVQLHTRLTPDFLPHLIPPFLAILGQAPVAPTGKEEKDREKEEKERLSRQRPVLRIMAELGMVGAWQAGPAKGGAEIQKVIKSMMSGDAQYANLPLLSTFLKHFNRAYLGFAEKTGEDQATGHGAIGPSPDLPEGVTELIPIGLQKEFREMFVSYFTTASKTLVKGHLKVLDQDKRNHEAYIKSGEIFEDRQHAYEKMTKVVEKLTTGVQGLADLLGLPSPVLPTAATLSKSGLQIVDSGSSFQVRDDGPVPGGIWDDEEEKRFYEELVDLKEHVPSALLGIKAAKVETEGEAVAGDGNAQETEAVEETNNLEAENLHKELEAMLLAEGNADTEPAPTGDIAMSRTASASAGVGGQAELESPLKATIELEEDQPPVVPSANGEEDAINSGPAARLSALFAALPEASNREMVDKLAIEFAFLNSKAARRRLVKFIGEVPKNRTDLLAHYARLIATLNPYMPDIGTGVIEILDAELRYLQRKKLIKELDSFRLKNVRFYGELAKFKVTQPFTILHVFKVFLDDFKANIDNISNLLETCGRFLLRYEGTAVTAKSMVELMRRKQGNSHLDQRQQIALENAFYTCNPPERVVREVITLTPMESWIQHLMHNVLVKRTIDKVLKYLRKLHWEDPEVYKCLLRTFSNIWELKYGNIGFVAGLVYDLQRYHPEFGVTVMDQVMENIRIGMEENIFKFNQRRLACVKYLGELYMYRAVSAAVIFDTLWSLISFGHPPGPPIPGRDSPIDAVHDFFRVRLVCTLLDTCGSCFDRGSLKRKLDAFLVLFQLYVTCKIEIPMDVEFMLSDTMEALRPKTPRLRTFAQAAAATDELLASQHETHAVDDAESDEEGPNRGNPEEADEAAEEVGDITPELIHDDHDHDQDQDDQDQEEAVVLIRDSKKDEIDEEAAADFDREFAKMMADTTDARRGDQRRAPPPVFDTAIPHVKKREEREVQEGRMNFTLLSKKGNRQQMRSLDIPMDSNIAVNLQAYQQQSLAERQQLKRLVLQNEARQEQSEVQSLVDRRGGIKWRVAPG